jgi:transcriptional regulator with XRE-family HTH domain
MLIMRAVRVVHGLPLYLLARRTGISQGRLSCIERELVQASPDERHTIATALDTTADRLFMTASLTDLRDLHGLPQEVQHASD